MQRQHTSLMAAIVYGGLVAGTVDIGMAAWINWASPEVILYAIASGALGAAAFSGGLSTALQGLGLQWGMSLLIAAIYVFGVRRIRLFQRSWIPGGLLYGAAVYVVMTFVVVPLSAAPFQPNLSPVSIIENLLAMFLFGLIVAFFARKQGLPAATADPAIPHEPGR